MDKYVIFDIDGTLNQTDLYALDAYKHALKKRGIEIADETIISCIGLTPEMIISKLFGSLDEKEKIAWSQDIIDYEFTLMTKQARPFNGIEEMLEGLCKKGYCLAICSNAYLEHIERVLGVLGIRSYFEEIGSLEMGLSKAETLINLLKKINCKQVCLVGDRKFDLEAAREAKIPLIGCGYGYAPDEIQAANYVINDPLEILDIIDTII